MDTFLYIGAGLALLIVQKLFIRWLRNSRRLPFPPGPKPGLTGNTFPTVKPWLTLTDWGKEFGGLVHAREYGHHVVIVNSLKIANDLFEKRSHIYSDRPVVPILELMGWTYNLTFMGYGEKWRRHRRMFQQAFRRDAAVKYRLTQLQKVQNLLQSLLNSPDDFMMHIKTMTAAIIMSVTYGYNVGPVDDHFVLISEAAIRNLGGSVFPGAAVVNTFPLLRYLPSWMPGCGFKRLAEEGQNLTGQMQNVPFNFVRENMVAGGSAPCLVAELLEENDSQGGSEEQEETIKRMAAAAYGGGADTGVSAIGTFFLAMALHPEVQRKAQEEIDRIVGSDRLPVFEDRPALPYVEAIFREVMRWQPVVPLGMSHATTEDDVYNGYFIPKGATVIGNAWAMSRDESVYSEPELFLPERFLTANGELTEEDASFTFGFGRRKCPGLHLADLTVWVTIVSVLSVFRIAKAKDAEGNVIEIHRDYSDGLISHPHPFQCSITPRSEGAQSLVLD